MCAHVAGAMVVILVTGSPGCGKTTLVRAVANRVATHAQWRVCGFFSRELRHGNGQRCGFELVDAADERLRCTLATAGAGVSGTGPRVSKYVVNVVEMEQFCGERMEAFLRENKTNDQASKSQMRKTLFLLDEVGKMELFSHRFRAAARKLLVDGHAEEACAPVSRAHVLCTIVQKSNDPLVQEIRGLQGPHIEHVQVTTDNREALVSELSQLLLESSDAPA
ncbi:Nucleoside-triphosphatase THEP1 [Porphyridium purpureum]|uniref:Nucleoside-triphosphatase THEP1 n=1 Tax=Porphyridium purpureum TaxID=35688 RepID=A0A5J4YS34_PORPP|nr:Nucleoside-triphosphatase THEP1 [Porphyridium purpureum]|eukprot:POR8874..scf236_6